MGQCRKEKRDDRERAREALVYVRDPCRDRLRKAVEACPLSRVGEVEKVDGRGRERGRERR